MTLPPELRITNSILMDSLTHLNGHGNYSLEDGRDACKDQVKQVEKKQINCMEM